MVTDLSLDKPFVPQETLVNSFIISFLLTLDLTDEANC